jgi:hypothetical protein
MSYSDIIASIIQIIIAYAMFCSVKQQKKQHAEELEFRKNEKSLEKSAIRKFLLHVLNIASCRMLNVLNDFSLRVISKTEGKVELEIIPDMTFVIENYKYFEDVTKNYVNFIENYRYFEELAKNLDLANIISSAKLAKSFFSTLGELRGFYKSLGVENKYTETFDDIIKCWNEGDRIEDFCENVRVILNNNDKKLRDPQ